MQRLFSAFPGGWPGVGLTILRLTVGIPLVARGVVSTQRVSEFGALTLAAFAGLVGALLVLGLWTPVAAALDVCLELWFVIAGTNTDLSHVHSAAAALSLIMLGPGAYSMDARLFGRKRIEFPR